MTVIRTAEHLKPSLLWEVEEHPVIIKDITRHDYKGLIRSDNDSILNVAKKSYHVVTNSRFGEIAQKFSDVTGFPLIGFDDSFNNGGKLFAYLANPEKANVGGFDFDEYMVLGNSHDSSTSLFIATTTEMIRCKNQFSRLNKNTKVRINHTKQAEIRVEELLKNFTIYNEEKQRMYQNMERMGNVKLSPELLESLALRLFELENVEKLTTQRINLLSLFDESVKRETSDIGDNLFGWFNSVTHYTTHVKDKKSTQFGNILGHVGTMNARGYDLALSTLKKHELVLS